MSDIVPRSQLTKQGTYGVLATGGGVALLVLAGGSLFGIIAGGVLFVVGLALSGSKSDRALGIVTAVVGGVALATGLLGHIPVLSWFVRAADFIMRATGIVLIGTGIYSLVRFFGNLRKRG
jgi:glucose dehydrogenase